MSTATPPGGPAPQVGPGMTGPAWEAADPAVRALFALQPLKGDNPIGTRLQQDWVQLTMVGTPGEWAGTLTIQQGTFDYAWLFFGDVGGAFSEIDPTLWNPTVTPVRDLLGAGWWQRFATTLVTQAISNVALTVTPTINIAAVQSDLDALLPQLLGTAQAGYQLEYGVTYAAQVSAATAAVGPRALATYRGLLTSPYWVAGKEAQAALGTWSDAAWELFHHAVKLRALGGTADDITAVLGQLSTAGLALPSDFSATTWTQYAEFLPNPAITWDDLANGISLPTSPDYPTQPGRIGMLLADNEGTIISNDYVTGAVSQAFVANMANKYYIPPKGSCFTASARVLLPDGTDLALAEVRTGREVWTPDGPRAVRVVPQTSRQGRHLYRLDGSVFAFSDSHPFVDGSDHDASLGVHVPRTGAFSPGLAGGGIRELAPGATVAVVGRDGAVTVTRVTSVSDSAPVDGVDEEMVDLILEPGQTGFPSFAVGDGGSAPFYLVRAEVLRYEALEYGTIAGIGMLIGASSACCSAASELERADAATISEAVQRIAQPLLSRTLASFSPAHPTTPASPATPAVDESVARRLGVLLDAFNSGADDSFDWRLSALQEALAANLLAPIHHAVLGGWRPPVAEPASAAYGAVTVHDLLVHPGHAADGDWTLDLLVDGAPVGSVLVPQNGRHHHRAVGWTVPTAVTCTQGTLAGRELTLRITRPDGPVLTGTAPLPPAPGSHHHGLLAVRADGESAYTTVRYDLRLLDTSAAADHPSRPPQAWDHRSRVAYAEQLGAALAGNLIDVFPAAVARLAASKAGGQPR